MTKNICLLTILLLVALAAGCAHNQAAYQNPATPTTAQAPDNSEVTTSVDATGTKTETRTFRNNPHISKVVVTTRDGKRTVRAYSASGQEREITTNNDNVLEETGDAIAKSANFVADKAEDVPGQAKKVGEEAADKAEDVGDKAKTVGEKTVDTSKNVGEKTVDTSKTVGEKTVDTSKNVGEKTVEGAKKVGDKTVEGAKKVGDTTKKAVKKVIP